MKLSGDRSRVFGGWGKTLSWVIKQARSFLSISYQYVRIGYVDIVFVPYPGFIDVLTPVLLKRRNKIILDGFISLYDTLVCDRRLIPEGTIRAKLLWRFERFVYSSVDRVLVDTDEHADYLSDLFVIDRDKFFAVPVGIDQSRWVSPTGGRKSNDNNEFLVGFWGTFSPLHGVDKIVDAAFLLREHEDVRFHFIGDGQVAAEIKAKIEQLELTNIEWHKGMLTVDDLIAKVAMFDLALGVFGDSKKSKLVIPYKIYHACALNLNVISQKSKALQALDKGQAIMQVESTPEALAKAIFETYKDPQKPMTRMFFDGCLSDELVCKRLNELFVSV